MAGLEKFEPTEEWRNNLKKFLCMERKVDRKPSEAVIETQRYSMDICPELQSILKEKNIPRSEKKLITNKIYEHEKKENHSPAYYEDDTFMESQSPEKLNVSEASFEAMEKMCNKSASDPDSTLFHYLHSDNKREIIEASKKGCKSGFGASSKKEYDVETEVIDRLVNDLSKNKNENLLRSIEVTQIEDIEEPSRFWDNTVLQTSPVKMVGLLRPSTIIEEGADVSDVSSAQTSYKSANRALLDEASSSCYDTASENASVDNPVPQSEQSDPLLIEDEDFQSGNVTRDLIDFEKTMSAGNAELVTFEKQSAQKKDVVEDNDGSELESDESIIEILSDEEDVLSPFKSKEPQFPKFDMTLIEKEKSLIKWETPIQVKKENISVSIEEWSNSSNNDFKSPGKDKNSLHFNDTLEEVEYMMKKGMEMLEANKTANESSGTNKNLLTPNSITKKQDTFTLHSPSPSPSKTKDQKMKSPFADRNPYRNEKSPQKIPDRFAINMKPLPKLDLFKKPTSACKPGSSAVRHKDPFAHVVSPIGTYVNKTAKTPLITTTKMCRSDLDSTAFRELEYESRLLEPKFNTDHATNVKITKPPNARTLPKKAYISSDYRQVQDERSPVTIPGGKSIQKYLDSAVLPAVIRHDGKAKFPDYMPKTPIKLQKTVENNSNTPKRQLARDNSLADLSVASGDVSVYTIKDAQKL